METPLLNIAKPLTLHSTLYIKRKKMVEKQIGEERAILSTSCDIPTAKSKQVVKKQNGE